MKIREQLLESLANRNHKKADEQRDILSFEARREWLAHPMTQSILARFEANIIERAEQYLAGSHIKETFELTALENVKLTTESQTYEAVIDYILGEAIGDEESQEVSTGGAPDRS